MATTEKDVSAYIKSCGTCQLTGKPNHVIKPAPLQPIPAISQPFVYLIIDRVGPLPRSRSGSQYLLTVMCQSTRYPAAYPLRTITARSVVKVLLQFVSVFGIPRIIQSDQGSNFSSHLMAKVLKLPEIKRSQSIICSLYSLCVASSLIMAARPGCDTCDDRSQSRSKMMDFFYFIAVY